MTLKAGSDRGIALVLTLLLTMVCALVAASMLFMARSETLSTSNYRLMSQARYGAESGIAVATNYLLYAYTPPATAGGDPLGAYTYDGVAPVTWNGSPVVLSADSGVASNYPVAAVQTAFVTAAQGSLASGSMTVTYKPVATLMSMRQVQVYGGGLQTVQTWRVTSKGSISTIQTATVEVTATLETQTAPAEMYAAFGTNGGCGALNFRGNTTAVNSYDSTAALVGGAPVISASGGSVGTNGNLTEAGGATINGTLFTPRVGVGSCSAGNVSALTSSGGATVTGGITQLPQALAMPAPALPSPLPPTTSYNGNNQTLLDGASVGDISVNANKTLTLCAPTLTCTINVNSITLNGNSTLIIAAGSTVILNVVGTGQTTPIDFTGGTVVNGSFDPSRFQIKYAGTDNVKLNGGSQTAAMIYAPNAAASFNGGGDFFGSVVAATVTDNGGASIHYDRHLAGMFWLVGNPMLSAFSWQRY